MFKCLRCGKTLHYPSHFEKHRSRCRGTGVRCPLCLNIYPSMLALRIHVLKSHGDIWSRCPICGKTFKHAVVHYSKMMDDEHRTLWVLTAASKGRRGVKEPSSIRGIVKKYIKLFNTGVVEWV